MMSNKPVILIVEDAGDVAQLVRVILRKFDLEIHHVDNGQSGLVFLESTIPDLMILDIAMPVMNGWQFLEMVRELPDRRQIPVIMLTAHTDSGNRMVGQMEAVAAYLTKPIAPDELRGAVTRVLGVS
jgi:DNA-binding response OmpR family regulator